ncbi:MAG TPA: DegT/DnrJ/EryC1/StrS family aminotransferase, partial [Ohtaekwangia sp.]|nr:DegT/DnrJ/EryC1/StrS family aminotransferase [Ohtaekwangia sp.]
DKGVNSRLDEIQAAVLRIKLRHLDAWNEARRRLADAYLKGLHGAGDLILPLSAKEAYHVYHQFVIRTDSRDLLQAFLHSHGVETMIHYPIPPHLQPAYSDLDFKKGAFPMTERIAETALSLPIWPGMEMDQVYRVIDLIHKFFK